MSDLLDTFPLPTIVVDKNFVILSINESGLNFFDTQLHAVCSKKITTIFPLLDVESLVFNKDLEALYINSLGIKYNLTIQFNSYLKNDVYGLFYVKQLSISNANSVYSSKKTNLLIQKLHIFESFLNQINQGILIFNESGQLIYVNANASKTFELKNKKINKFYSWQLFDYFGSKSHWGFKKKEIELQNEIVFTLYKSDLVLHTTSTLSVVVNHRLIESKNYYVVTYTDITEIEKDKFLISEKENHLNLFHKNIPAAIYEFVIADNESCFNYISNAFQKIFGFEIAINDKNWNSGIKLHQDDFHNFIDTIQKIKENVSEFKFIGRFLFGYKVIWFETNASVTYKDDLIIFNGIILNITERKKNEEEILSKRKLNDSVLFNIPADIAVFDKDHNYQFINSNGIVNQDVRNWMIGKNDFDYCHFKGLDTKMAEERHAYFVKAKETKQSVDWIDEIIRGDKKVYIFRRFYPYYIENEFVYMIGYGIDVTELKEAQFQMELQNRILINKNQELERFTYVASHDLQEPLLSLISFSKLLEEECSEKLDDEGKLFVQFINKSAIRMKSLITGLMEYNRINKKEILSVFDLNILINEVQDDLSNKINKHNAIITFDELPTLRCYPTFIRIVFQNLISNSIKFTSNNVMPQINISFEQRKEDWLFKVTDNGIGLEAKDYEEIFMIFKRLHNEQSYAGQGIGLAHCKKIVEIHNGEIWVESIKGKGSTFYFTISKNI